MPVAKPTASQLKEWNGKLAAEGLSIWAGREDKRNIYVTDTDIFQTKPRAGRLARYKLGNRISHHKSCLICDSTFSAKRIDALTCSKNCRNRLGYLSKLTREQLQSMIDELNRFKKWADKLVKG